ncbi:hypothetical protein SAMN05421630_115107 [Prauserella marina]|uniref:Uncharacterized protein n=1 Tax=Prauserella marina TaxID=530584 RepID=A0A1G6Z620_9PSEU|nr:hypothetical protein DES30_1125 [Prauserella marina]SDD97276.1 hypothetical protein SAMN05421630_115107 [Prauserella marina]
MRLSRQGSGLRRQRVPGGRPHEVTVRLSDEELEFVEIAAAAAGLSKPSFLVASVMSTREGQGMSVAQRETLAAEVLGVTRVLRRAAENLNRLTRVAQAQGSVPAEVPMAVRRLVEYVARFDGVAARLDPRRGGAR